MTSRPPSPRGRLDVRRADGSERELCLDVRRSVFVAEQGVPEELEVDGLDPGCAHFLAHLDGAAVGTARLRVLGGKAKIERVAVLADRRDAGIGRALMDAVEAHARGAGFATAVLNAQTRVAEFYERLGYRREGEVFLEANIPHVRMTKPL